MAAALFGWGGQPQQRQHQGIVGRNGADSAAVAAASAPFASSASGCDAFDAGVGAATLLHGTATWGVVLTPWVEGSCDDWEGLVGLDAEVRPHGVASRRDCTPWYPRSVHM
jgi:hypothetical protein